MSKVSEKSSKSGTKQSTSKQRQSSRQETRLQRLLKWIEEKRKLFTGQSLRVWISILIVLFIVTFALMTTGCVTRTLPSGKPRQPIPANLLQPCQKLEELENGQAGTVLRKLIEVAQLYYECADSKQRLIEAVQAKEK